jgi:UDP-N-acetyl-D-mannosaminuronate dehydrogenase
MTAVLNKIANKFGYIIVIGVGYVRLPLVAGLARAGFRVIGFDKDARKARAANDGESYIDDVPSSDLARHAGEGRCDATTDPAVLKKADAAIVCMPTSLNKTIDPLYLPWKLRTSKYQVRFIDLADSINSATPDYVVARIAGGVNDDGKAVRGSRIWIYGVA